MKANFFDTHFHLDLQKSKEESQKQIEQNSIYTIAVTNLPILYERLKSEVNSKYIRVALGFHPELIEQYRKYIPDMWRLLPQVKYIGEVGLDFKVGKKTEKQQLSFFEELIRRCDEQQNKVLSVHSRSAVSEVNSIIGDSFRGNIILHWYSGTKRNQIQAINNGYYFSVNYAMLSSESGRKIIKNIPDNRILIETDSPFTTLNGEPFNLSNLNLIVEKLALLKGMDDEDVKELLWKNFISVLSIG